MQLIVETPKTTHSAMLQTKVKVSITITAWLLLLASHHLHAQTVYEWSETNGTLAYSDHMPTAAQGTVTRTLTADNAPNIKRAVIVRLASQTVPVEHPFRQLLTDADGSVAQAITELQQAELALQYGQVPQPGERSGLFNGHSRLNGTYFERINMLEAQVLDARAKLQSTYSKRDELKQ